MDRNIIVTGSTGNLGRAVIAKFKREGYQVIALVEPGSDADLDEADDVYQVDVTDEQAVLAFAKEYHLQYGELDCLALLVGGFAMGSLEETSQADLSRMFSLNFFSAFNMVKAFLPAMKRANQGCFLFVGAKPSLEKATGTEALAYALSKGLVIDLAEYTAHAVSGTQIRSHVFVPSIIDTPQNRESMPEADFTQWVSPSDIAEAMHYAVNTGALRNMTFKLYGGV
ncbi:MAG: SDR family NAD(P)-dependent oxidoreductase [Lunatimonas sp.]|uniref:SDR family NAD(P)-dependent oxidoreductase n=1 Tax=Lunatimonas sp. TaxID=2060141 RepID=UPI00263A949F|nr:SDR family NAD(P)-dependent oxidoreductase [Lunatimonas sp.]MCC5936764.1 SDR family NAD(P)-dependent oxidoreductase [Lunatimonas sp.]